MRKLLAALFLIMLAPAASDAADRFMGLYLVRSNLTMPTSILQSPRLRFNDWGVGVSWGKKYNDVFVMEFDGEFRELSVSSGAETDDIWNVVAFGGGRAQMDIPGADIHPKLSWLRLRPYAGLGIGLSLWVNDITYMYTSYPGGHHIYHSETTMKTDLAFQIKFGLAMPLNDRFDIDAGMRYQRLGRPGNKGAEFDILGGVMNVEYRLGIMYRY